MKSIDRLCALPASELARGLREGDWTSERVTSAFLCSIEKNNERIGAFLRVFQEEALAQARESDARISTGEMRSALDGVPVALKDNILVKGEACTCASRMLKNFSAPYDATVTERLRASGLPILGKLNMDEFAMGSTTEHSAFFPCRNPWDETRVPGGSSGGAAAAVAAGMTPLALGSDTGGSIRLPASFCGVTGFKPAYGAVSRYGLVAFASSFDQIGPVAKTARDAAMLMTILRGRDPRDATSDEELSCQDMERELKLTLRGITLGLPDECFGDGLSNEVRRATERALDILEKAGASLKPVSVPDLSYALPAYYVLSSAEASSNLARYDGVRYGLRAEGCETLSELYQKSRREGLGQEVKRRVLLGAYALSSGYQDAYYRKANAVRQLVTSELEAALSGADALAFPVAPTVAYPLGDSARSPMETYLGDVYTVTANIAGLPALSAPIGLGDESGLPVGLSLMGARMGGAKILGIASAMERLFPGKLPCEGGEQA